MLLRLRTVGCAATHCAAPLTTPTSHSITQKLKSRALARQFSRESLLLLEARCLQTPSHTPRAHEKCPEADSPRGTTEGIQLF